MDDRGDSRLEVCRRTAPRAETANVPFIMLTGRGEEAAGRAAWKPAPTVRLGFDGIVGAQAPAPPCRSRPPGTQRDKTLR